LEMRRGNMNSEYNWISEGIVCDPVSVIRFEMNLLQMKSQIEVSCIRIHTFASNSAKYKPSGTVLSWGSSVSTGTAYELDGRNWILGRGEIFFSS
jgi:hypothetical protein